MVILKCSIWNGYYCRTLQPGNETQLAQTIINKEDLQRECEQDQAGTATPPSQALALQFYIANNNTLVHTGLTHVDVQGECQLAVVRISLLESTSFFQPSLHDHHFSKIMTFMLIAPNFSHSLIHSRQSLPHHHNYGSLERGIATKCKLISTVVFIGKNMTTAWQNLGRKWVSAIIISAVSVFIYGCWVNCFKWAINDCGQGAALEMTESFTLLTPCRRDFCISVWLPIFYVLCKLICTVCHKSSSRLYGRNLSLMINYRIITESSISPVTFTLWPDHHQAICSPRICTTRK